MLTLPIGSLPFCQRITMTISALFSLVNILHLQHLKVEDTLTI